MAWCRTGIVPHICISELGQHWFRWWLVACSAPSQYLNQCWVTVNWTLRNKLQWNFNQTTKLFIHKNASENIVCEKAAILSRGDELISLCMFASSPHQTPCYSVDRLPHWESIKSSLVFINTNITLFIWDCTSKAPLPFYYHHILLYKLAPSADFF